MFHNSHDINYRRPFGAVCLLTEVTLRFDDEWARKASLVIWEENNEREVIPMHRCGTGFEISIKMPDRSCVKWYYFISYYDNDAVRYYGNNDGMLGGVGSESSHEPLPYQITVYKKTNCPQWYKNSIVYQIFPDRFCKGSDFEKNLAVFNEHNKDHKGQAAFIEEDWTKRPYYIKNESGDVTGWPFYGGTLGGIMEKLDYLKSLNISAIYLNPIFMARSNHRYDTADYMNIDPLLGDNDSFRKLCAEARKRGISIILDGVFNHTGADSIYFDIYRNYENKSADDKSICLGAFHHIDSPYRDWFRFNEDCECGYESWWGVKDLPDINELDESYTEFITGENGVIKHWLRAGASGFRLDVADELPDEFIKKIRSALKSESEDDLLIGEVWEDASNKRAYGELREYFLGDELDAVMNYPLRDVLLDFFLGRQNAHEMVSKIESIRENYPPEAFYGGFNLIGSHDRARSMTVMSDDSRYVLNGFDKQDDPQFADMNPDQYETLADGLYALARFRMQSMTILQFVLPGVPVIYYGDEAGMLGSTDPYNRGAFPWGLEDEQLLAHYRKLTKAYTEHEVLISGGFYQKALDDDTYMTCRYNVNEMIITVTNRNINEAKIFDIKLEHRDIRLVMDLFTHEEVSMDADSIHIELAPIGTKAICLKLKETASTLN